MGEKHQKFLFLAPALIILVVIVIYPMIYALRASFFMWRYGQPVEFVGLRNYVHLFGGYTFYRSIKNTFYFIIVAVSLEFALGLFLALLMNRVLGKIRTLMRTVLTIPMFTAPIAVGILWRMLYNPHYGLFNWVFHSRGFAPIGNMKFALFFVVLADVWQWTPFMYIIFLAALQTVPQEIIEAARVDGASYWQSLRLIILPHISFALVIASILRLMDAAKTLDLIYTLTMGGPGDATETASFTIFRLAFNDFNIGSATAYSWIFILILGTLILNFLSWLQRRIRIV